MKSFKLTSKLFIAAMVLMLALSACGAKASTPTPDVQGTAMAAANTMVAETQAAMPTATPIPPTAAATDTPQPTPTIPPLPTAPILASPTAVSSKSSGDCQFLTVSPGEKKTFIRVNNKTNQLVGVTFYLKKNAFGDCGYWSTQVSPNSSIDLTNLPWGCYYVGAWTLSGKPNFQNLGYPFCDTMSQKFTISLTVDTITFPQ